MGTGKLELGNVCAVFDIETNVNKELYDYIDEYQQRILKDYSDLNMLKTAMEIHCNALLKTRIDGKVSMSFFNDFVVYLENNRLRVVWNLHTPLRQRLEYDYSLEE